MKREKKTISTFVNTTGVIYEIKKDKHWRNDPVHYLYKNGECLGIFCFSDLVELIEAQNENVQQE